ncbi:Predicted Fe-Mo cluster-binding protein, NifX family [Thermanaeromonas toyohensis ToBE]|uniref:Predicted Fe-Mo cluster-binding protein, NifX family n=1 Tax=Thermanaeromonas toyohensis ToBE TaxID=698762 RepID=A0A1W1W3I1_9FIRM|nr:NifB/NifX family molybdenum-iron cluster-binding protein [Thermanaeromonas toyohensis]SMB99644.1 Predicted Fe-Mo cluster-binding protein, NifX family [Thermanaeromonas toyohensis ToBE]
MKIAVATEGNMVAEHFGHCSHYTLFEVKSGEILSKTVIPNPGHQPGFLPGYLASLGVECVIAGGMGARAMELFAQQGIETITGVGGLVDEAVREYLRGNLKSQGGPCQHDHHHGC